MILRCCLSILVLVHLSVASCDCYKSQNATSVYTPAGPRDSSDYTPCYPNGGSCLYVANTLNDSVSLCDIQFVSFQSSEPNTTIVIQDGTKVVFTLTPADVLDSTMIKQLADFVSSSSTLNITMNFLNNQSAVISFYFYTCPKPVHPTLPTTTPAQTFPTISGAPNQPGLIGADIAFAFVSAGSNLTMFNQMKDAITATVNSLNVVKWKDNPKGVRLGLSAPSNTDKPNTFGDQWNLDSGTFTSFVGVLPQMIGIDTSRWIPALEAFLNDTGYFDPNADVAHRPRKNVQKIFVFFTQSSPSENSTTLKESLDKLATRDVHMVVVDLRSGPDSVFNGLLALNITNFAYMNFQTNNDFLFNYVLQSDNDANYGCTWIEETKEIGSGLTLSWPINYPTTAGNPAQYCNNQQTTLALVNKDPSKSNLCVSILSYELETEKDYLRFFAGGEEIASFTGIDVVGSKFLIFNQTTTTVSFTTNENTIYKGVTFTITATASPTCP